MILVDTCSWIHMLRPGGDPAVRARVEATLANGEACWCPLVQLELWNGARGQRERRVLREFARTLPELPIDDAVWNESYDLARRARATGVTILACARRYGVDIETADSDFELLASIG